METKTEYEERMAAKMAAAKWPDNVPKPTKKPKLKLRGSDGNAFAILGKAQGAAEEAKWTPEQIDAFHKLATSGDYNNVIGTCMDFFDVR